MKEVIKKSALWWLTFSLTVITVWVAYAALSSVGVWETLSSTKWNGIVAKVNELDVRPAPALICVTKTNTVSSSWGGWKSVDVSCDAGYLLTGCWDGTQFSGEHWWRYAYPVDEMTCRAGVYNNGGSASSYSVYARCCKVQ